jgi:hypothetical protein
MHTTTLSSDLGRASPTLVETRRCEFKPGEAAPLQVAPRKHLQDLGTVAADLGSDAIPLCWESFNVRCYRRLVAEWLEEKLGIVVPEEGHERGESIPFSEQPSKWDGKPTTANADDALKGGRLSRTLAARDSEPAKISVAPHPPA